MTNSASSTLTGTGSAQAAILTSADLTTLGNGTISVAATATDAAGNSGSNSTSFTLDTVAPTLTVSATVVDALVPTTAASGSGTLNKFASTSALADGGYVRVWQSNKTGDFDIYGQVYNADGSARGAQFVVNSSTTGDQGVPLVVALKGSNAGKFVVTWVNGSTTPYTATFARVFSTSGSTVTADAAAVQLSGSSYTRYDNISETFSGITALSNGGFVLTNMHSNWSAYMHIYDGTLSLASVANGVQIQNVGVSNWPDVVQLTNGNLAAIYMCDSTVNSSTRDVYLSIYNPSTSTWVTSSSVLINTVAVNSSSERFPKLAALTDGSMVLVWQSDTTGSNGIDVYMQRLDASGNKLGSNVRVNTTTANTQGWPDVLSLKDGGYLVYWRAQSVDGSGYAVVAQRYDNTGTAVGSETRINRAFTSADQVVTSAIQLANGDIVFTYQNQNTTDMSATPGVDAATIATLEHDDATLQRWSSRFTTAATTWRARASSRRPPA